MDPLTTSPQTHCVDCEREYGNEFGFPDLIISNDAWNKISPTGNGHGLLCPSCICKRLHKAGIKTTGIFRSGPLCDHDAVNPNAKTDKPTVTEIEKAIEAGERVRIEPDGTCLNLTKELTALLNRHSVESASDTPDFILAEYLMGCLKAYDKATRARDSWFGLEPWSPAEKQVMNPDERDG